MTEVIMPKMGDGMEEGTLLEWLKKEGDKVKSGEVIGTIQTDKATLELEAPGSGTLAGVLIQGGATVPVGKPIAALLKDGESLPANWGNGSPTPAAVVATPTEEPTKPTNHADIDAALSSNAAETQSARLKVSPLAKKIAAEKNIDLATIVGSGPGGRIVEKDVLNASTTVSSTPKSIDVKVDAPIVTAEDKVVPLSRLKKITGERTQQAKLQAPHIYVTVETDVERILILRDMFESEGTSKPSINDFVIRACALALQEMPVANASFSSEGIVFHGGINIGIAAAIDEGLTVPVLKNAYQLSLKQISSQVKALVTKAKTNKLSLNDLSGSTFSISNMGMLDVDNFCAIINVPNAAILAISSARKKVVPAENDELEIRHRMNMTGSFDHRVMDGADAAKFMNIVRSYLENPTKLLS